MPKGSSCNRRNMYTVIHEPYRGLIVFIRNYSLNNAFANTLGFWHHSYLGHAGMWSCRIKMWGRKTPQDRHCEERSDVAIQGSVKFAGFWIVSQALAKTSKTPASPYKSRAGTLLSEVSTLELISSCALCNPGTGPTGRFLCHKSS